MQHLGGSERVKPGGYPLTHLLGMNFGVPINGWKKVHTNKVTSVFFFVNRVKNSLTFLSNSQCSNKQKNVLGEICKFIKLHAFNADQAIDSYYWKRKQNQWKCLFIWN